jgi:hypothetical protein
MTLTPEQTAAVTAWLAAGDNLSRVQTKLREQFNLALTYMDVRFLVDDLNLQIKDPIRPPPPAEVKKASAPAQPAEKKGFIEKAKEKLGFGGSDEDLDEAGGEGFADEGLPPAGAGGVKIAVDAVTLLPGAVASGTVTFSDGVTGKWIVDQYGRPGFTEVSKPGYRPSPTDAQSFMTELGAALQKKGF